MIETVQGLTRSNYRKVVEKDELHLHQADLQVNHLSPPMFL